MAGEGGHQKSKGSQDVSLVWSREIRLDLFSNN